MDPAFDNEQYKIKDLIVENNVIVLTSGTGLGKTTRVPLYMIELFTKNGLEGNYSIKNIIGKNWRHSNDNIINLDNSYAYSLPYVEENSMVLCTQPKEILASEPGKIGSFIASSICFKEATADPNKQGNKNIISFKGKNGAGEWGSALTFVTSGWLSKYMINNPYLNKPECNVSCVIVDEAHERTLEIDVLLGLLKKVLLVRPNFKIVIMSATINEELFQNYYYDAPTIRIEPSNQSNRNVAVDIQYLNEETNTGYLYEALEKLNEIVNDNDNPKENSDIIVFVSGQNDMKFIINDLANFCGENIFNEYEVYTLLSGDSKLFHRPNFNNEGAYEPVNESDVTTNKKGKSKIIISTNVAESSLTFPHLKYVIDCGVSNQGNYYSNMELKTLSILPITKASADQRKGRVGRVASGTCYRLYNENFFDNNMKSYTLPAILTQNIENLFIEMLTRGINFLNFDYIEPPSKEQTANAMRNLHLYGIIDEDFSELTDPLTMPGYKTALLYSSLNYVKARGFKLEVPNILLHMLINYIETEPQGSHGYFLDIILTSSMALSKNIRSKLKYAWEGDSPSNCELLIAYNELKTDINIDARSNIISKFQENGIDFNDEHDDSIDIKQYINDILQMHGNVCNNGKITMQDGETIYFDANTPTGDNTYTYVSCNLFNDTFKFNLLTLLN